MRRKILPDVIGERAVVRVRRNTTVRETAELMRKHDVGAALIVDNDKLEGIITVNDVTYRVVAMNKDPNETLVGQVMTIDPDTIRPDSLAIDALRLMQDGGYRHLPVVDGDRILGVVSRRDFYGAEKARLDDETAIWERLG